MSSLQIAANTFINVTADADITMNPGSTLSLTARAIDFWGKINVPSGNINLTLSDNITSFDSSYLPDNTRYEQMTYAPEIILENGSQISAAG